ncbi:hypothetical protein J2795_000900 [Chryseobacterium bernardetii]|uniref:Uncharacterized protein n=3 Tax=Chryseobacterium TaxID=59732 RepID=A0A543ELL9_9FLAO|nr:hypothetical protein [Chryseobacterium vietnamense]MDR6440215.1 hypothetical protein [Chryseobacterium bernardetii]MDR6460538.1 hypothetical protein [Chryseobacterium vietnamense]MDR6489119.1 hypothetical protein [Chryseobacterium vietnamense]TQM22473.1 hypothetical protein FB551_2186 [Chryseobacterium aquifrigidense]
MKNLTKIRLMPFEKTDSDLTSYYLFPTNRLLNNYYKTNPFVNDITKTNFITS